MEKLKISTGTSRTAAVWKTTELTWPELVKRLSETQRTSETMAEYRNMPKSQQGSTKDVGGFVGGVLKNGKRNNQSVSSRYVLTLDADYANANFISQVNAKLPCDYIIYSTHTHTPESPRYRLVVSLSRAVSPEEYQAIGHRVASDIGIDFFDDSTFEPARLMYWPSTCYDGEFVFEECSVLGGLDVDSCLSTYDAWQDVTQWPTSSRIDRVRIKQMKQADPLEKPGLIGHFCRAYTIEEAIAKFIPDVYVPCEIPNRYTYAEGSTTAGLVIYDNKFAFSNHGTDPAGGELRNAFDLVRVHLYHDRDHEAKPDTPANKLPSFIACSNLLANDPEVKMSILDERRDKAQEAFADIEIEDSTEEDHKWLSKLEVDGKGRTLATISNMKTIMDNDRQLKGICILDAFDGKKKFEKNPPWRKVSKGDVWEDVDDSGLRCYMEQLYGVVGVKKMEDAFNIWVEQHKQHPARVYLDSLVWDGIPRIETLLIDYLGAEDDIYTRTVTRKTLTAGVARIYKPGCKFDNMLTLVGEQGVGKSTLINKLGMRWYTDSVTTVLGKEGFEQIQGFWIVEFGELKAMSKTEEEAVKLFLSKREDSFRAAYGHHTAIRKRQCIFLGTTNKEQFLRDTTGNRRFWPVKLDKDTATKSVFDLAQADIDQLWAEAKYFFKAGETLYLDKEVEALAREKQEERLEESPYKGTITKYLDMRVQADWDNIDPSTRRLYFLEYDEELIKKSLVPLMPITRVCAMQIWVEALGGDMKGFDKMKAREINDILKSLKDWDSRTSMRFKGVYGTQRGYAKKG